MTGSPKCKNCQETQSNIETFSTESPNHNLAFIYLDNREDDKLESMYYQMNGFLEYPRTVVYFRDIDSVSFIEGVLSVEKLKELSNSDRKS